MAFFKGLLIGFSIAVPVGPIGMLCLRRSLTQGRLAGFVSGLGAATADALYGIIAALGLTAVTSTLLAYRFWLQLGGGLFLLYLGGAMLRARPRPIEARPASSAVGLGAGYLSTLVLTAANPMTILSFLGIFAAVGVGTSAGGAWAACLMVAGVFVGSGVWWLLLSTAAGWLGTRLQQGGLRVLNVLSGLVIVGFGAWQLWLLTAAPAMK